MLTKSIITKNSPSGRIFTGDSPAASRDEAISFYQDQLQAGMEALRQWQPWLDSWRTKVALPDVFKTTLDDLDQIGLISRWASRAYVEVKFKPGPMRYMLENLQYSACSPLTERIEEDQAVITQWGKLVDTTLKVLGKLDRMLHVWRKKPPTTAQFFSTLDSFNQKTRLVFWLDHCWGGLWVASEVITTEQNDLEQWAEAPATKLKASYLRSETLGNQAALMEPWKTVDHPELDLTELKRRQRLHLIIDRLDVFDLHAIYAITQKLAANPPTAEDYLKVDEVSWFNAKFNLCNLSLFDPEQPERSDL
jgi:hypothetical protein